MQRNGDATPVGSTAERKFFILRYQGRMPAMAGCAKCQRKFFTPSIFSSDPVGAEWYLLNKFDLHRCSGQTEKRAPLPVWQMER